MQLPLLASTFLTVFLAELGDKPTAIVTISTSNRSGAVFAGSASALVQPACSALELADPLYCHPHGRPALAASVGFLVIGGHPAQSRSRRGRRLAADASEDAQPNSSVGWSCCNLLKALAVFE